MRSSEAPSCRADSSSVPPSPARWCSALSYLSPMSPSPRSIRVRRGASWISLPTSIAATASPCWCHCIRSNMLRYCPRTIALRSGEVVYDGPSSELTPALLTSIYGADNEELFLSSLEPAAAMRAQPPLAATPGACPGLADPDTVPAAEHVSASNEAARLG